MAIPLEDNFTDVIGKAQRGLRISDSQLAEKSGVSADRIRKLRDGAFDDETAARIAPALQLDSAALCKLGSGKWNPETVDEIDGLAQFNTNYGDITVNAYLVWDPTSREAVAFDTGADCGEMLQRIEEEKLSAKYILLTHAHPDHVADLRRLKKETGAPAFVSQVEPTSGAEPFKEGQSFTVGSLRIETRKTSGHSVGGTTFVISGLGQPVAVVGDSLFAGSMGGGGVSYSDALENNRKKILTLAEETIICPGHGPLTSVGEEKEHNPFFPEFQKK